MGPNTYQSGWTGDTIAPRDARLASRTGAGISTGTVAPATAPASPVGSAAGNMPVDVGLASRDPAFLQSLANRILPGANMGAPVSTGLPAWLPSAMNSLANLPFSGGGMTQRGAAPVVVNAAPPPDPANMLRMALLQQTLGALNWDTQKQNYASTLIGGAPPSAGKAFLNTPIVNPWDTQVRSLQNQATLLSQPAGGGGWGGPAMPVW